MPDRRVHVTLRDGREVVRYERAGKWYIEQPGGRRFALRVADAVSWVTDKGAQWHVGTPGGQSFDAAVRRLLADHQCADVGDLLAHHAASVMDPAAWGPEIENPTMGQILDRHRRQTETLRYAQALVAAGMLVDHIKQGDTHG